MVVHSVNMDLKMKIEELQNWLKTNQTQLPECIAPTLLKRFLHTMHGDLELTKNLLELNYTLRNKHAHIFIERDPLDETSQQLLQIADLIPLPGLTPDNNKLLFYRLIDYDPEKFNFTAGIKVFFMVADCRFALEGTAAVGVYADSGVCAMSDGEIPIFDMAGYSLRHLTKTVFSSLRIYMKFVQEAHPVRLKGIHVLNCPSYLDKVLTVVKPFIKSEVFKLIHFHLPNSETPYKFFPRSMLPAEYGGDAGKISDMKAQWMAILKQQREYLMDSKQWRLNKGKKVNDSGKISANMANNHDGISVSGSKALTSVTVSGSTSTSTSASTSTSSTPTATTSGDSVHGVTQTLKALEFD